MATLPKAIYRSNAIPIKIPTSLTEIAKHHLKSHVETQNAQGIQNNLDKRRTAGGIAIPGFSTQCWHKNRLVDQ